MPEQRSSKERPALPLTVPAGLVSTVRGGLYAELGLAVQEIDQAVFAARREACQDTFRAQLARLDKARGLLAAIGWTSADTPVPVVLDLREHHAALSSALEVALVAGEADLKEAAAVDAERAKQGLPPKAKATIARVRALHDLDATAKAEIGTLADDNHER
jgi:hypothetical protein